MPKKISKEKATEKPNQTNYEKKIIEFGKKGLTSEKIGEELRQQGIHPKEHDKTISQILKEKELYVIPELKNVEEKLTKIEKHLETNKQDKRAKREKTRIFSQLRKIKKYHKIKIK